jgi:DNA-directed RNA polymerase specialized sigma24 family protein
MISGSIQAECDKRLSVLYHDKHRWLISEAKKLTKNTEEAEDLVQELFEYLHIKQNPKLFWGESYNIFYCNKSLNRTELMGDVKVELLWEEDVPYDEELDRELERAHNEVINELKSLSVTRLWPSAKIFELYWMSEDTLQETADKIGISKSTTFIAVKKIRKYLQNTIKSPFNG